MNNTTFAVGSAERSPNFHIRSSPESRQSRTHQIRANSPHPISISGAMTTSSCAKQFTNIRKVPRRPSPFGKIPIREEGQPKRIFVRSGGRTPHAQIFRAPQEISQQPAASIAEHSPFREICTLSERVEAEESTDAFNVGDPTYFPVWIPQAKS